MNKVSTIAWESTIASGKQANEMVVMRKWTRERESSDTTYQPNAALISLIGSLRRALCYKGTASLLGWSMSDLPRGDVENSRQNLSQPRAA